MGYQNQFEVQVVLQKLRAAGQMYLPAEYSEDLAMDMKKYMAVLQVKEDTQQAPLCNNADTVQELLYNTYYEHVCTDDTDEIKQAFDDLYQSMTGKISRKKMRASVPIAASVVSTNKPASSTVSASASNSPEN